MTVPGALDIIQKLAVSKSGGRPLGAGTVLDADTAAAAIWSGADFVVSPLADPGMIAACRTHETLRRARGLYARGDRRGLGPGRRHRQGLPGDLARPQYFRDSRGRSRSSGSCRPAASPSRTPGPSSKPGPAAVGIGTALVDKKTVAAGDWNALTERARRLVESLRGL